MSSRLPVLRSRDEGWRPGAALGAVTVALLMAASMGLGDEGNEPEGKDESTAAESSGNDVDAELARLEEKFQRDLTRATLKGRWYLVRDGEIGEPREESYTIRGVSKVEGDTWLIHARVQYGDKDVTLPVPVKVKWAGDTPVISVTNAGLPGLGTYTARVLIYNDTYAGSWFGKGYGGLLSGQIVREDADADDQDEEEEEPDEGGDEE